LLSIEAELSSGAFNLLKKRLPHLPAATLNARDLTQVLVRYRVPSLGRSIIELAMTVGRSMIKRALASSNRMMAAKTSSSTSAQSNAPG
jgi:hypothetical protein